MYPAHQPQLTYDEQALLDPLHFAMASRDADVLTLVREALGRGGRGWHINRSSPQGRKADLPFTRGSFGSWIRQAALFLRHILCP